MKKGCKVTGEPSVPETDILQPEIKEELLSEPEPEEQSESVKGSKTYQIKDDKVVSKSKTISPSSSELKIANVFRISENLTGSGFKISDCTSQFNSDCAEIRRRSVRKHIPTEKMRDFQAAAMDSEEESKQKEKTADATKTDSTSPQQTDQPKNKTISIKTPQSINDTVKSPVPPSSTPSPSPSSAGKIKYQKVTLKKVENKDNGSSHVILSPHKGASGNKLVYVKRIMQPLAGFTNNSKSITLKGGLPRDIKVVPYKNSLHAMNRDSIVIKKLPPQQLKLAQGLQLKRVSVSTANAIQAQTSASTTSPSSSSTKSLPAGVKVLTKEQIQQKLSTSSKPSVKSEKASSQSSLVEPRNKVDIAKNQQVTQNSEQNLQKKLEMENFYLRSALNEVLEEMKGIRSKLFTLERNVRSALDDRPPVELPTPTAPTPSFTFKTEEKEKSEGNKVFKLPKLPISDLDVFEKFEQDLSYRKFYDLVYSRLANMVPTRAARRTLHRYLRFIISEDLLCNFVWDIKWMRNPTPNDTRMELAKYFHFQSLLFGLVNHHKTINYPDGMKWTELESFIKSQLKTARVKKRRTLMEEEETRGENDGEAENDENEEEDDENEDEESDSTTEAEKKVTEKKAPEKTGKPQRTKSKESEKEKEKEVKVQTRIAVVKEPAKNAPSPKPKTVQLTRIVPTPKTVQITKVTPSAKSTPQTIKIVPSINLKNLTLKTDDKNKKIVIVNTMRQSKSVVLVKKPGAPGEKDTLTFLGANREKNNSQEPDQKRQKLENDQKKQKLENDQKKQKLESDQKQEKDQKQEQDQKQEKDQKQEQKKQKQEKDQKQDLEKPEEEKDPIKEEPMDHEDEGGFD